MKKRWIALYVENDVGVLAKISGLFSGKSYNLESLTVGTTKDPTVSRMTIGANCSDDVFEQIKKQLNRMVDVIKVIDLTDMDFISKEVLFIKINKCSKEEKKEILNMAEKNHARIVDYNESGVIIQSLNSEEKNNEMIDFMRQFDHVQIIRGGSVAVERL